MPEDIKILVVDDELRVLKNAERLIASDYIGKSFTPDTLIAAVDKVLR